MNITENLNYSKPIQSLINALNRSFKLTSSNDVDKAVMLACYLVSIGEILEAKRLLDFIIEETEHNEEREDIWAGVGQGLIQRIYLARLDLDLDLSTHLCSKIIMHDYYY